MELPLLIQNPAVQVDKSESSNGSADYCPVHALKGEQARNAIAHRHVAHGHIHTAHRHIHREEVGVDESVVMVEIGRWSLSNRRGRCGVQSSRLVIEKVGIGSESGVVVEERPAHGGDAIMACRITWQLKLAQFSRGRWSLMLSLSRQGKSVRDGGRGFVSKSEDHTASGLASLETCSIMLWP